jgi:hypothetical protein
MFLSNYVQLHECRWRRELNGLNVCGSFVEYKMGEKQGNWEYKPKSDYNSWAQNLIWTRGESSPQGRGD